MGPEMRNYLCAIRVERRVVWRVDGLPAILAGSSRNHGPPPTIARAPNPDPNRGKVLTIPSVRVDGSEN